jgi:hypothetical protein
MAPTSTASFKASGRLSEDYALAVTAHVCDALAYAHSRGIVHRDIKPANVLIDQEGNVKVADFGLAKMVDPQFDSGLTMSNVALGTPDYVAPEVLSCGMEVDHRADLYAVGVMLYQMLTGELPRGLFKLPSQKYREIDPRLDGVICRALEPDREERYQSAVEVRAELFEISTARLARMEDASLIVPTPMPRRRIRGKTAVMIGGLAVLVAAGTWGWNTLSGRGSASTPAPPAEIDLLKTVDLKRDVIAGDWYWDPGGLRSRGSGMVPGERGGYPRVEFPQAPPPEYDFEVEFTADTDEQDAGVCLFDRRKTNRADHEHSRRDWLHRRSRRGEWRAHAHASDERWPPLSLLQEGRTSGRARAGAQGPRENAARRRGHRGLDRAVESRERPRPWQRLRLERSRLPGPFGGAGDAGCLSPGRRSRREGMESVSKHFLHFHGVGRTGHRHHSKERIPIRNHLDRRHGKGPRRSR